MSSIVKDCWNFAKEFHTDFMYVRTQELKEGTEKYERILSLGCRAIGVAGLAIGLWLRWAAVGSFLIGHDWLTVGANYRAMMNCEGKDMEKKRTKFIKEYIRPANVKDVNYDPVLHGTWVIRHLFSIVATYKPEDLAEEVSGLVNKSKMSEGLPSAPETVTSAANTASAAISTDDSAKKDK